jgi:hypothetical protein
MIPGEIQTKDLGLDKCLSAEGGIPAESCFSLRKLLSEGKPKSIQFWDLRTQIPLAIHHRTRHEKFRFLGQADHIFGFWSLTFTLLDKRTII